MTDKSRKSSIKIKREQTLTPSETVISFKDVDIPATYSRSMDMMNKTVTANSMATTLFDDEYDSGAEARSESSRNTATTSVSSVQEKYHSKRTIRLVFSIDGVRSSINYNLNIKSDNPDVVTQIESIELGKDKVLIHNPRKRAYRMSITGCRMRN